MLELEFFMSLGSFGRIAARWATPAVLAFSTLIAAGQSNGIFADFTTSLGSFTCQLDYTNAPRTCANFIGLATGERPWLDLQTGRARTNAFYDGLTFHRVIAGFMNQGGSPNGQGTDGPGYAFKDEFSTNLIFDSFGVLAMANSGPNSDGSQFFITVAPFPSGNNVYSIFGRLTSGSNVVYAINHVLTDANDKPVTNVVIQHVAIRHVGAAAQSFNISSQLLPNVMNLPLSIAAAAGQVTLTFTNRQYADNQLYTTLNLNGSWSADALGIEISGPVTNSLQRTNDAPKRFYRMAQIQYPSSTLAPKTMYGRTLTLNFTVGPGLIVVTFDANGGGSYTWVGNPAGTVSGYDWSQEPYRGFLWPLQLSGIVPMTLRLDFATEAAGTMSGTAYFSGGGTASVSGTFGLTGP